MSDLNRLTAETRADEGYKPKPYKDTRQLWTFGEGRCLETHPLSGAEWKALLDRGLIEVSISVAGADLLERQELAALEVRLAHDYDFWPRLNDARQNALLEMAYQMGVEHEEAFRDMLGAIRTAMVSDTPAAWAIVKADGLDSAWARETPGRANRVLTQLATGVFP